MLRQCVTAILFIPFHCYLTNVAIYRLQKKTEDSNGLLDRLDELVSTKHDTLDIVMNKLHGVLNARQVCSGLLLPII